MSVGGRFLILANPSFFKPEPKHKQKNTRYWFDKANSRSPMAVGCRDANRVGMLVSVLGLCADAWRENTGMAVSRVGPRNAWGNNRGTRWPGVGGWNNLSITNLADFNSCRLDAACSVQLDSG